MVYLPHLKTQQILYTNIHQQNELVLLIPGVLLLQNSELLKSLFEKFELPPETRSTWTCKKRVQVDFLQHVPAPAYR